jgi:hypothetical protein
MNQYSGEITMKKIAFTLLLVSLALAVTLPVLANRTEPVGTRINILEGQDVEVSGPFHVSHGYRISPSDEHALGQNLFVLEIDGVKQDGQKVVFQLDGYPIHTWLFNYPDSLEPGQYTFTGRWYSSVCWNKAEPCDQPGEVFEWLTQEITVTVLP